MDLTLARRVGLAEHLVDSFLSGCRTCHLELVNVMRHNVQAGVDSLKVRILLAVVILRGISEELVRHECKLEVISSSNGKRQRQERIKCYRNVVALEAAHCALQLAVHEVNDDALIARQECLPAQITHELVAPGSVVIWRFDVGLFLYSIQVLVNQIKYEVEQLAGILLTVTCEASNTLAEHSLELMGCCPSISLHPHIVHE